VTKQGRGAYSAPMPPVVGFRGQMRSMEERVKQGCREQCEEDKGNVEGA